MADEEGYPTTMKEKNVYYEVLRWGIQHIDTGVSFEDLKLFLNKNSKISLTEKRAMALFRELFTPLDGGNTSGHVTNSISNGSKFHLTVEAAFRRIEIQELEEARQSSRSAMRVAIAAIVIGALVGIAQICIALFS